MEGYQKTGLTFYTFFKSASSWRVRIQLHHKKLDVNSVCINLAKDEQKGEEYTKINPNQVNYILQRQSQLSDFQMTELLLSLLQFVSIFRKSILKTQCFPKTQLEELK